MKKFLLWFVFPSMLLSFVYSSGYKAGRKDAERHRPLVLAQEILPVVQTSGVVADPAGQVVSASARSPARPSRQTGPLGVPKRAASLPSVSPVPNTLESFKVAVRHDNCDCVSHK
jgi:hypothetical protein